MAEDKIEPLPPKAKTTTTATTPQTYQGNKIVASRPSRASDPGYQLSTIDDQVTITLEDGTEKVINPNNTDQAIQAREKQEKERQELEKQEREKLAREKK